MTVLYLEVTDLLKLASFHFDSVPLRYTCSDNSFDTTAHVVELCPQFHKMASFIAVMSSDRLVLTTASLWARCSERSTWARCNVRAAAVLDLRHSTDILSALQYVRASPYSKQGTALMYNCEYVPRDDSCRVTKVLRSYPPTAVSRMYLGSLWACESTNTFQTCRPAPLCHSTGPANLI